jgi:hypothetical protein
MVNDGSAYFLNVGYKHSVEHNGTEDRIALMFSLLHRKTLSIVVNRRRNMIDLPVRLLIYILKSKK